MSKGETKRFYDTAAWRRARHQAMHDAGWCCSNPRCRRSLIGLGKEAHVHHRKALRRAPVLALEPQNLRPLCRDCHMQLEIDDRMQLKPMASIDGTPGDPGHPWNAAGGAVLKSRSDPTGDPLVPVLHAFSMNYGQ